MTTAVLKNRLLSLTDRQFNEATYGASSLADFVSKFSDILNIDDGQSPTVIELKDRENTGLDFGGESRITRIRSDLWRAIFDRSSGNTYYWLAETGEVATEPTDGVCPILPTIDAETACQPLMPRQIDNYDSCLLRRYLQHLTRQRNGQDLFCPYPIYLQS